MAKSFETKVEINGAIGSSFTDSFRKASSGLVDLRKEARAVQQEMDRLGRDFRQGKIHQSQYTDETQKLTRELNKLERVQQRQIANQQRMSAIKSNVGGVVNNVKAAAGMAVVGGGAVATAAFAKSINTAADFEAQMAKVGAKTEASHDEMKAMSKTALSLGAKSSLSASEVALGMDELGAKGMNANQIIQAMPGLIAGAEASGEDLATVSDVVTSAINSYGMGADQASRIADIMAMSANKSAADVRDLGYSFKYAAPLASTLGISIEELSAATGILTDKGLAGEQAGTSLRMALTRLSSPPTAARKALEKLNISVVDSDKKFKSLTQITEEWNKATENLTDTQKVSYASTIFGTEASTAMLSLFSSGTDTIKEMTVALENSAGAAEQAGKRLKATFSGAKEQMMGAAESAQIAFATPVLDVLAKTANGISYTIEKNIPNIENAGKALAEVIDDITAPFQVTEKPIKPIIEPFVDSNAASSFIDKTQKGIEKFSLNVPVTAADPNSPVMLQKGIEYKSFGLIDTIMNPDEAAIAMAQYEQELKNYEMFGNMNFGDKIEYMLDETGSVIIGWLEGDGGELVGTVFTELGTIAGKAWLTGFKESATGAVGEVMDGNIAGGATLAVLANALTGGLLFKGLFGGSKWIAEKGKDIYQDKKSNKASADKTVVTDADSKKSEKNTKSDKSNSNKKAVTETPTTKTTKATTKLSPKNILTKVVAPLTGLEMFMGGSKLVANNFDYLKDEKPAFLTSLATLSPQMAITGWGMNAYDKYKSGNHNVSDHPTAAASTPFSPNSNAQSSAAVAQSIDLAPLQAEVALATTNMGILSSYLGQASGSVVGSFLPMQEQSALVNNNMNLLSMYLGQSSGWVVGSFLPLQEQSNLVVTNLGALATNTAQASGWLASLQGIQPASQRVVNALNNLEQRINNIELPGTTSRRLSYE